MPTILVVEDDAATLEILERMLAIYSYTIMTADDGMKAITLARSAQPDLIIMDMGLPVLNGWQATYRLKAMPITKHIPIIALTAYALTGERLRCIAAGCDEYDTKPINMERLIAKIEFLLKRSSNTDSLRTSA